tara:strand:+ start:375 stop:824 length:450 start_codon:yes stop_codon:yes gene_type:complete
MYILSNIPKRLERWFIRCISPPRVIMELLEMNKESKDKKKQDALDIEASDKLADEAEAKQAQELADRKLANVGMRFGNSPFYRPIEQTDKLNPSTITALTTPTYQGGFKQQTQTTMGNLSGSTLAPNNQIVAPPQQPSQDPFEQQFSTI